MKNSILKLNQKEITSISGGIEMPDLHLQQAKDYVVNFVSNLGLEKITEYLPKRDTMLYVGKLAEAVGVNVVSAFASYGIIKILSMKSSATSSFFKKTK